MFESLKTKRQKFGIGSLVFMMLFGAVFAGVGYVAINSMRVDPGWTRVSGKVVDRVSSTSDGSTTYAAVVGYSVNGEEYRATSGISSSFGPSVGDARDVAYNPSQPSQAKVVEGAGTAGWLWIFPVIGVGMLLAAPIAFIGSMRRSKAIERLLQTGQKLQGVVIDVRSTGSTNGNSTYKIVVAATNSSGTVQNYTSDSISGVGGLAMADFNTNPVPVDVYVDTVDPSKYYVDIADIPSLTPGRITELFKTAMKPPVPEPATVSQQEQPKVPPTETTPPSTGTTQI